MTKDNREVISLYMVLESQTKVAKTAGISQSAVSQILRSHGITRESLPRNTKRNRS